MQERKKLLKSMKLSCSRENRECPTIRFPMVSTIWRFFILHIHDGHSYRLCIDLPFASRWIRRVVTERRTVGREIKKKRKKQHASGGACDYADVMEVIDERRWRSAWIPRPIFSGETRRRCSATLSLARAGFPRVCIYDPPISDLFGREWKGRAVIG